MNIKLWDSTFAVNLVKVANQLPCDINLFIGNDVINSKSLFDVLKTEFGKTIWVECYTESEEIYEKFIELFRDFKV